MKALNSIKLITTVSLLVAVNPLLAQSHFKTNNQASVNMHLKDQNLARKGANRLQSKGEYQTHINKSSIKAIGGTGVDGGGGNLKPGVPLTKKELSDYLYNTTPAYYDNVTPQKALTYMFNSARDPYSFQLFGTTDGRVGGNKKISKEIHQLLFNRKDQITIYDAIDKVEIVLQDEACIDPKTKELRDASAISQTHQICLSWKRLSKKLFTNNFESYLLPLLVHEYSHFVGTDEIQAEFLESFVKRTVSFEKASLKIGELEAAITTKSSMLPGDLFLIQEALKVGNPQNICIQSYKLFRQYDSVDDLSYSIMYFYPYKVDVQMRALTLMTRLVNLMSYCKSVPVLNQLVDDMEDYFVPHEYAFDKLGDESSILQFEEKRLESFYQNDAKLSDDQRKYLPSEGNIQKVSNGDLNSFNNEVKSIIELVDWLSENTDLYDPQLLLKSTAAKTTSS